MNTRWRKTSSLASMALVFLLASSCTGDEQPVPGPDATKALYQAALDTLGQHGGFHLVSFTSGDGGGRSIVNYAGPATFRVLKGPYTQAPATEYVIGKNTYFSEPDGRYLRIHAGSHDQVGDSPALLLDQVSRAGSVREGGDLFTFRLRPSILVPKGATGTALISARRIRSLTLSYDDGSQQRTTRYVFSDFGSHPHIALPKGAVVITHHSLPACDSQGSPMVCAP